MAVLLHRDSHAGINPQQWALSLVQPTLLFLRETLIFCLCPAQFQKTVRRPCVPDQSNYWVVGSNNRITIKVPMDMIGTILMVFTHQDNPSVVLNGDTLSKSLFR